MLIVYANPTDEKNSSYNYEILEGIKKHLKEKNRSYDVLDLYKMKFNPTLSYDELCTKGPDFYISPEVKKIQKMILFHDEILFVFPFWWGGCPAILKGFFDRVLTEGFAYYIEGNKAKGLLNGKKAYVITTRGTGFWFNIVNYGFLSLKAVTSGTLKVCGFTPIKSLGIQNCMSYESSKIPKIMKKIEKFLNK